MKKKVTLSLFIFLSLQMFPQINQGDVIINSFDPYIDGLHYREMVVLVNYTSSPIDLNGYEIRCYKYDAFVQPPFWQFNGTYTLQPYSFLLITNNINNVSGVPADIVRSDIPFSGRIDHDGYLTFQKIGASNPSEYIDIVKYSRYAYPPPDTTIPFTDVPPNSGIDLTMPGVADDTGPNPKRSYLTRGGVSGNISSLTYTGYGMVGQTVSDFFEVPSETDTTYIQNSGSPPLPVELSSFTSKVLKSGGIKLEWRTETEVDNYGFNIERRINESDWNTIGFIEGHGNTNSPKEYSYTDKDLFAGGSKFQYRLKQLDTDGQFEYSYVVEVEIMPTKFELSQNYPNPFNPSTTIRFSLPKETKLKINIYNILGELVETLAEGTYEAGYHKVNFNASPLSSGAYIYRIESSDFVQVKKMLLLK